MKAKYIVIFFLSLLSFVACDKEEVVIPTTALVRFLSISQGIIA